MSISPKGDRSGALAAFGVQAGPQAGEEVPIRLPVVTIGRGNQNDIVLADDSVSTTHARLEYRDGGWRLSDLESTNGTFVESVRLAPGVPTPLPYGASVRFGAARLHFREVEQADPEAALAAYAPPERETSIRERRSGIRVPVWFIVLLLVLIAVGVLIFGLLWPEPAPPPATQTAAVTTELAPPPVWPDP
jgi:hypothetical protein